MAATPLRIAVVDDHEMVRRGLVNLLLDWPHGQVVLEAEDGIDYEKQVALVGHIHVAIVDLQMPHRDGYDTMHWIARHHPRTRTLGLSYNPTDAAVHKALRCGACGLLPKTVQRAELHTAILRTHTEGFHFNELVDRQLRGRVEHELATRHPDALWDSLSPIAPRGPGLCHGRYRQQIGPRRALRRAAQHHRYPHQEHLHQARRARAPGTGREDLEVRVEVRGAGSSSRDAADVQRPCGDWGMTEFIVESRALNSRDGQMRA